MGITFKEIGDDCSICPVGKAGLCSGLVNYGNGPVYPPCSEMDENMDAEAYMGRMRETERRREEQRKEKSHMEAEKKRKKELQKKRRQVSDSYCRKEIEWVNKLKKMSKALEDAADDAKFDLMFSEAMAEGGIWIGNIEKLKDVSGNLEDRLVQVGEALGKAQKQLAVKRVEVRETEAYKNII